MSCWMTGTKELAILAKYVAQKIDRDNTYGIVEGLAKFYVGDELKTAFSDCLDKYGFCDSVEVYKSLYKLNAAAYCDRYGEKDDSEIPTIPAVSIDTREDNRADWQRRLYWLLSFFNYQTCEGMVADDPRRKALCTFSDAIARTIANDEVKKNNLKWGSF